MKDLLKIYGKYVVSTWGIILLLLLANIGIFIWIVGDLYAIENSLGNGGIDKLEYTGLEEINGELFLNQEGKDYLAERGFLFLMVLNDQGDVRYGWNLPKGFKTHYTVGEAAVFSRWYLNDYPVRVLNTEKGLLVAGREKGSIWKYHIEFSEEFMRNLGKYFRIALEVNSLAVICAILFLGFRYYKSLLPLIGGIFELSANHRVELSEKGVTARLAAQVNRTSNLLEQQRKALNKRDEARTEWIAGISHDIRTPLSVIVGYADELENKKELCEEDRDRAASIKAQSLKIKQLIEDLNLTSKLEYNMQPLRAAKFYPAALLRRLAAEKMNEGIKEQYELILEIDDSLESAALQGDEKLIARAVGNLLNNSILHNPQGCHIVISGRKEGDNCIFQVSDDGCGIPEEVIELLERDVGADKAFDGQTEGLTIHFESAGEEAGEKNGHVSQKKPHIMGLKIVKQITLAHKGSFQIKEEGHTVQLALPLAQGETPYKKNLIKS